MYDSALRCGLIIRRSEGFLCQSLFFGFRSTIRHCRSASLRSQSSVAHWSSAPLYPQTLISRFSTFTIHLLANKFLARCLIFATMLKTTILLQAWLICVYANMNQFVVWKILPEGHCERKNSHPSFTEPICILCQQWFELC